MDGRIDGGTDRDMYGRIERWIDGWTDREMYGRIERWIDGWTDREMDRQRDG